MIYKKLIRPWLFKKFHDPEDAHACVSRLIIGLEKHRIIAGCMREVLTISDTRLSQRLFELNFPNPVGLAAGMDKTGETFQGWDSFGLGFCEIGGVVPLPQKGNDRQRMFRIEADEAIINRMGFNSPGMLEVRRNVLKHRTSFSRPLGINIGKNKDTPLERALEDYVSVARQFFGIAEFFVVNVSSPNTPNLRQLQDKTLLLEILTALQELNRGLFGRNTKPILVKVAPDLTEGQLEDVAMIASEAAISGIVAVNTTVSRIGLREDPNQIGGLSGAPLRRRGIAVIRMLRKLLPRLPLIGVGGIFNAEHAVDYIKAGANLVQVFTGLVYEGPLLPYRINRRLLHIMDTENWSMSTIHPQVT